MRLYGLRSFWIILCFLALCTASHAQQHAARVAVIVGKDIITTFDLEERLALAVSSSGLKGQEDAIPRLLKQIVRLLIDETLQTQEARRIGVSVSDSEVAQAFYNIEKANKLKFGEFEEFLAQQGVSAQALKNQLRAQLLWNKIVSSKIRNSIRISEQDVDESIEYIVSQGGATEVKLQEIILPVDKPEDEDEVIALSQQLLSELDSGANFSAVAKEFSRSYSAASGGEIGWTRLEQLPKALVIHLREMEEGAVSKAIKIGDGYYIVKILDKRVVTKNDKKSTELALRQGFVPAQTQEDMNAVITRMTEAGKDVNQCQKFPEFAESIGSTISSDVIGTQLTSLNKNIRQVVEQIDLNELSPPIRSSQGIHVVMVCERQGAPEEFINRTAIKEELFRQRLNLRTRQYLRNLQRNSYIEVRL